jgi:hypothetical protein
MSTPLVVRNVVSFIREFLARDRYLTEALAALVTFGAGVMASLSLEEVQGRVSLAGFRDMPYPELWAVAFTLPGLITSMRIWWRAVDGERAEGVTSVLVMSSFLVLSLTSVLFDWDNWVFWSVFALQLGILKGYALVQEWPYLRWGVSVLGAFFWINFSISLAQHLPPGLRILLAPCVGFALANLLSVSRLAGRQRNA